jgi:membrane-bound metal-dependent hydrolase YbcI (DUF457 family)
LDNLTHSLFALTLARTGPARAIPGATATLLVASNAPDLDIVTAFTGGPGAYLAAHRGATHGPLGIVGLGVTVGAAAWLMLRRHPEDLRRLDRLGRLIVLALAGVLMHVAMDLPTVYGTRLLSPFSGRWFSYDWLPIIDLHLWTALSTGLLAGTIRPAARSRILAAVLLVMAGDYTIRAVAHGRAMTLAGHPGRLFELSSWPDTPDTKFEPCAGRSPAGGRSNCHAIALPTFLSPFQWRVITAHESFYELWDVNVLDSSTSPRARVYVNRDPRTARAAQGPLARIFLGFARVASAELDARPGAGTTVVFRDLRFLRGPADASDREESAFTLTATLGAGGDVVSERLMD